MVWSPTNIQWALRQAHRSLPPRRTKSAFVFYNLVIVPVLLVIILILINIKFYMNTTEEGSDNPTTL